MPKDKKTREAEAQKEKNELREEVKAPDEDADGAQERERALTELKNRLTEAEQKAEDYLDAARRIQAEFDNFRKRNAQVRTDAMDDGARDFAASMLPLLDTFERAVLSADEAGDEGPFAEGVRMLLRSFKETLEKQGVCEIEAAPGTAFDPNVHNAVLTGEPTEACPEGTIIDVMQKGYLMRDKALRIAMVRVAHGG